MGRERVEGKRWERGGGGEGGERGKLVNTG